MAVTYSWVWKILVVFIFLHVQITECLPWFSSSLDHHEMIVSQSNDVHDSNIQLFDQSRHSNGKETPLIRVPSRYESTILARRLLAKSRTAVMSTIFPQNLTDHRIPKDLANTVIGLPEYIASCEEPSGNPTLLLLNVEVSTQNAKAGSNVSLALSWWDQYSKLQGRDPWAIANLPRVTLIGYVEEISQKEVMENDVKNCFVKAHHDSVLWLPGDESAAHEGYWMRLVVQEAYWIGGFGDRNWIGWFDIEEWRKVTEEEWMAVRLPGET